MKRSVLGTRARSTLFHALRACFRALPVSESTRDALRVRFLSRFPRVRPRLPTGRISQADERRPRIHAAERAIGYVERRDAALPDPLPARLVAFYLPQFHTIPENDEWWGKGFTEWRNVARALPQYEGHGQPRLPGDLGFYDLRNPQVMRDQAELAKSYGLSAFCFYFYWFGGKTLLEDPLRHWLADKSIDFGFCLCWANENWTRRWDGRDTETLIAQLHSDEDDLAFIEHVAPYLRDPRYVRVAGRPLLLVYRPDQLPDPRATLMRWRIWCRDNGIGEIDLAYVQAFERPVPGDLGFDCAVEFPPNLSTPINITAEQRLLNGDYRGEILDWRSLAQHFRNRPQPDYRLFPGVNCGWDNEPRRPGAGRSHAHSSPRGYRDWLFDTISMKLPRLAPEDRLVFINAWNEWAEGAVLEPDTRLGHAWLEATRAALADASRPRATDLHTDGRACAVVHAWYMPEFAEILAALRDSGVSFRLLVTTAADRVTLVEEELRRAGVTGEITVFENRGRDILPFLHVANRLIDEGEDLVLKLHTKRSPHRRDGDAWRRELITRLVPESKTRDIPKLFSADENLGMLAPGGHLQPIGFYWGANQANVRRLCTRIGIKHPDPDKDAFVSGSMFWVRLKALRPLLDAHLDAWEFEDESSQLDGTLAHAIERLFALSIIAYGLRVDSTGATAASDSPATPRNSGYPYADSD